MYPTLARIALDILPIPAATVGVESLFSRGKETITDRRSRLDPGLFEQLQVLHYHWKKDTVDFAAENLKVIEEIEMQSFEDLEADEQLISQLDNE